MHTFSMSPAVKITENHLGVATVLMGIQQQILRSGPQPPGQLVGPAVTDTPDTTISSKQSDLPASEAEESA